MQELANFKCVNLLLLLITTMTVKIDQQTETTSEKEEPNTEKHTNV